MRTMKTEKGNMIITNTVKKNMIIMMEEEKVMHLG